MSIRRAARRRAEPLKSDQRLPAGRAQAELEPLVTSGIPSAISTPLPALRSADILALQRTLGNQAVCQLLTPGLQRTPLDQPLQRGWKGADSGGPNAGTTTVDEQGKIVAGRTQGKGVTRIPVAGLKVGNQRKDTSGGNSGEDASAKDTFEDSVGEAIVLIPNTVEVSNGEVDVLLHFHGMGAGYRQLRPGHHDYGETLKQDEVRDVALYQMEQQLLTHVQSSKRPIIAVLPQGMSTPDKRGAPPAFGDIASNSDAYLDEVFDKLRAMGGGLIGEKTRHGRLIISGHSGGGPSVMETAKNQAKTGRRIEVLLFDAINTGKTIDDGELGEVKKWVDKQITHDVAKLHGLSPDDQEKYLKEHGTQFRGIYSAGGAYTRR
jgi:hypothetical protein